MGLTFSTEESSLVESSSEPKSSMSEDLPDTSTTLISVFDSLKISWLGALDRGGVLEGETLAS